MPRFTRLAAVALVALIMPGCATSMNVSSHAARDVDFARYRTYDWGPADALPAGDARFNNNPFFQDHVQGEIERQLAAKGLLRSTSSKPDLLIHYHASVNPRLEANGVNQSLDVNGMDRPYRYCYDDCWDTVRHREVGTIVLDVVDARTKQMVWRGWAQDSVESMVDSQDKMRQKIHLAVTRMMEKFPPRA